MFIFWTCFRDRLEVHIFRKNVEIINKTNIALQLANPKWKDDISKWGCKIHVDPTNSHRFEAFYLNITILDLFNAHATFHMYAVLCLVIWVFNLLHSCYDDASFSPIPTVSILNHAHLDILWTTMIMHM